MAGHVELRHHADAAIMRVRDEVANLILGIKHAIGPRLRQLGKSLAFDAESLVIRKMPVEDIHLHRSHSVDVALEHVDGNEMAAHIDQQAAPREARLVIDGDGGRGKSGGSDLHELKKSLQPAQDAQRGRRRELRAGIGDGQFVRFILIELLYGLAAMVGVNLQSRRGARLGGTEFRFAGRVGLRTSGPRRPTKRRGHQ